MPQIKSQFTLEQIRTFEEENNLWISNHESLIEILMRQEERIQKLEERLMEVGSYIPDLYIENWTLADKWK